MSTTLMQASNQWRNRPDDQRFTSLIALDDYVQSAHDHSRSKVISSRGVTAIPVKDGQPDPIGKDLMLVGPNGGPVNTTHWSFGQLAQRAGAPANYLRTLPAPLAADNLNYGLKHARSVEDLGVLLYKSDGMPAELRAVTGPGYGRVWNAQITGALVERFGDGISGDFRVPGEFGKRVDVTKANTTLYASDRDMFVFLADEEHRISVANRRDGKSGDLARGFFVWNSEVGSTSFGIALFLFDYVCMNRIVWGVEEYKEIRIRHTKSAPDRWIEDVVPAIEEYAASSTIGVTQAIAAAQRAKLDNVDEFLRKRFSSGQAAAIQAAHIEDEQRPIETIWDATTAVTAYARSVPYQDERVNLERKGGALLDLVK